MSLYVKRKFITKNDIIKPIGYRHTNLSLKIM